MTDEYIDLGINTTSECNIDFDGNDIVEEYKKPSFKTHLEDGDKLVWYKDPTIVATWHLNGRIDIFDKQNVSICDANFRIQKGHWRDKTEHGVGTEPNHWLFNGTPISDYLSNFPSFWKSLIEKVEPVKKERKHRQKVESPVVETKTVVKRVKKADKDIPDTRGMIYTDLQGHNFAYKCSNDDMGTIAFSIPRNEIQQKFAEKELRYNCIYFLVGYSDEEDDIGTEKIYVGQAKKRNDGESVLVRLREHDKSTTELYRDIWQYAIVVTGREDSWTLDDLNALENIFYNKIPLSQNLNGNTPNSGGNDSTKYERRIADIESLVTACKVKLFTTEEIEETIQTVFEYNENNCPVEDLQNGMSRIPEIVTPNKIVNDMVNMLPADVWNSHTIFLDPACKGGEYLREIYNRLMNTEIIQSEYPNDFERHYHILKYQLFGIALSKISQDRTTKSLMGFGDNIRIIPNYINYLKGIGIGSKPDGTHKSIKDILNEEFGQEMKIDVVIGNPPYQDERNSIYQRFIELGCTSAKIVCLITRNNWFNGKAFKNTREQMLSYGGIKIIKDYPIIGDVFKGVQVAVASFLWKSKYKDSTHYTRIENGHVTLDQELMIDINNFIIYKSNIAKSIIDKLNITERWTDRFNTRSYPFMDQRKYESLDKRAEKTDWYNVQVMNNNDDIVYTSIENFKNVEEVLSFKVVCGVIINEAFDNKPGNVLTNIQALGPYTVSAFSWSLIATFKSKDEAINCKKYINTKFVKFLCNQTVNNRSNVTDNTFQFVPLQDFTSNDSIDWSQPIGITSTPQEITSDIGKELKDCKDKSIDAQLYRKYNLSNEEIAYIEKTIKPME